MPDDPKSEKQESLFRPNVREIIGEAYKILFGAILAGFGVFLLRLLPPAAKFFDQQFSLALYQIFLLVIASILIGCAITIFVQGDLIRRLRETTRRDERTGLMNLRAFNEVVDPAILYSRNHKEPLAILFIDIDGFKKLNTEQGYETGNYILLQLGQMLTFNPRLRDRFFRYGGDEFVVLVPNTNATGGLMYAQNIRKSIKTTPFKVAGGNAELNITISAGVAELDIATGQTREIFLACAEAALNRAKIKKDEVVVYDPKVDVLPSKH